jgi:hypothetical protein
MIMHKNAIKNNNRKNSKSNFHTVLFLIVSTSFLGVLFSYSTISISAQQDKMLPDAQTKKSVTHIAIGHESHQVVDFVELKDNILYNGSITFKSSIPVDVIVYNDTSNTAVDNTNANNTNIKPWKIDEKTFVPTTIMKNATSGTIDFRGSGITTHIPYNQTYDVTYSIKATPSNIK